VPKSYKASSGAIRAVKGGTEQKRRFNVKPAHRGLDGYDVFTFIAASRYVTLNVVMILLALAVVAFAFGRAQAPLTIAGTSAGTVLITTFLRAVKNRRGTREDSHRDGQSAHRDDGPEDQPE